MRLTALAWVTVILAGCAAAPEPFVSPSVGERANFSAEPGEPEIMAVVELEPSRDPNADPEGVVCRDDYMTGSRIVRTRCESPRSRAEREADELRIRADLEYAREMAAIERQMQIERQDEERRRRTEMPPPTR